MRLPPHSHPHLPVLHDFPREAVVWASMRLPEDLLHDAPIQPCPRPVLQRVEEQVHHPDLQRAPPHGSTADSFPGSAAGSSPRISLKCHWEMGTQKIRSRK
ncbi:unnamed protein product [Urochloa humidicola]